MIVLKSAREIALMRRGGRILADVMERLRETVRLGMSTLEIDEDVEAFIRFGNSVMRKIERFPKPIVAAINGHAMGGGCEIAMACHLRLLKETARMGQTESNLGIIPGYAGSQRLPRLVGKGRALEILLTGDMVPAARAYEIGLVNKVVPAANLLAEARQFAAMLAAKAPIATRYILEAVNHGMEMPLADGQFLDHELEVVVAGQRHHRVEAQIAGDRLCAVAWCRRVGADHQIDCATALEQEGRIRRVIGQRLRIAGAESGVQPIAADHHRAGTCARAHRAADSRALRAAEDAGLREWDLIVAIDGALAAFPKEFDVLPRLVKVCESRGHLLVGISKDSQLHAFGQARTDEDFLRSCQSALDRDALAFVRAPPDAETAQKGLLYGDVYYVRFHPRAPKWFRVDVGTLRDDPGAVFRQVAPYCRSLISIGYPLPLFEAHRLSHVVKDRLMAAFPQIADAIIHIEPPPPTHKTPNSELRTPNWHQAAIAQAQAT